MKSLIFTVVLALGATLCSAADTKAPKKAPKSEPSRQELIDLHQKMSDQHKKMVDCLKSDKSVDECRQAAMKDCPMAKGGKCPFMSEGCADCGMKGRHHHHGNGGKD